MAVTIYDDIIQEVDKHFGITLKRSADLDSRIVLVPVLGQIGINDNDGMLGHRVYQM